MERNSIYVILAVTVALTQASCQKEEMVNRLGMSDDTIKYAVSMWEFSQTRGTVGSASSTVMLTGVGDSLSIPMEWTVTDGIGISPAPDGTKGTLVNTTGDDNMALSEFASLIGNTFVAKAFDDEGAEKVSQTVTWSTTSSAWVGAPEAKWPKGTSLDFLAYANLPGSQTATITKDGVSTVHTVPASAADQKDILFGHYSGNGDNTGTAEIRFEHPLTAVRFLQGELGDGFVIKGISLEGIAETGTASMAPGGTITWSGVESHEYTVSQDKADGLVLSDLAGYDGAKLIGETFIIIPQDLEDNNVTVTVTFTNGKTATAELATGAWEAGKTNTYTLSYIESLDIEIQEDFDKVTKESVKVKNTGSNVNTYIRMAVIANWVDGNGNVAKTCDWQTEGTLTGKNWGDDKKWKEGGDGWFYYVNGVRPESVTEELFSSYAPGTAPYAGTHLDMIVQVQAVEYDSEKQNVTAAWGGEAANLLSTNIE